MTRRTISNPQPNRYPIPIRLLQGNLAEMLFWDAIFYLFTARGKGSNYYIIETDYQELTSLTGLTEKTLRKQLDQASTTNADWKLRIEEGIKPYSWHLILSNYLFLVEKNVILKPCTFMSNGWGRILEYPYPGRKKSSRFPLAIINLFSRKPPGTQIGISELVDRCKKTSRSKPPDIAYIYQALDHLLALGLIKKSEGNQHSFNWPQLNNDANKIWKLVFEKESNTKPEVIAWARAQNPQLATVAEEIAIHGQLNMKSNFKEIFESLHGIRLSTDLEILKSAVYTRRHQPDDKHKWDKCWRLFQNRLEQRSITITSSKEQFDLKQTRHKTTLVLPKYRREDIRWAKLVLWVNDSRFAASGLGRIGMIKVCLFDHQRLIWSRQISHEDVVIRTDLTALFRHKENLKLTLVIRNPKPWSQFTIDAQIEVQCMTKQEES